MAALVVRKEKRNGKVFGKGFVEKARMKLGKVRNSLSLPGGSGGSYSMSFKFWHLFITFSAIFLHLAQTIFSLTGDVFCL